jgi:hypothetical protein
MAHLHGWRSDVLELPPGWSCTSEGTEWVCRPGDPHLARRALVVLTAKVPGPNDTVNYYWDYLRTPRPAEFRGDGTERPMSTVLDVRRETIAGRDWIRARHRDGLLPGWVSEYVATVNDDLAILLTFSAKDDSFEQTLSVVAPLIQSISPMRLPASN